MPEHIKCLVVLDGIQYTEDEAVQVLESVFERSSVNVKEVGLFKPTAAKSTRKKKAGKKPTNKKTSGRKKTAARKTEKEN